MSSKKKQQRRGSKRDKEQQAFPSAVLKFGDERRNRAEPIEPIGDIQAAYLQCLYDPSIHVILVNGPPGCGKTWMAAAVAAEGLSLKTVSKVLVARPDVLAEKDPGAMPGDKWEKFEDILSPVMGTLKSRLGTVRSKDKRGQSFNSSVFDIEKRRGRIDIQMLAAIRGQSFDDPVMVIVDEAQNVSVALMKSLLTRPGKGAKMVLCGDPYQSDIKGLNGMTYACGFAKRHKIPGVAIVEFTVDDIVRLGMVKAVVVGQIADRESGESDHELYG